MHFMFTEKNIFLISLTLLSVRIHGKLIYDSRSDWHVQGGNFLKYIFPPLALMLDDDRKRDGETMKGLLREG